MGCRWEALEEALAAVVDAGGDMRAYWKRWHQGKWWWFSTAEQTVYAGPGRSQTCKKARAAGRIS
jgi:hypothetical protein